MPSTVSYAALDGAGGASRNSGIVSGLSRRVSNITPQPVLAYVKIWIGDELLTTIPPKPNMIQGFSIDRLEAAGAKVTFSIFDDDWDEIEYLLSKASASSTPISVQYGYYPNGLESPIYKLMLQNYSISFHFTGVQLSINALSQAIVNSIQPRNITTNSYNPTEAIKSICNEMGWTIGQFDVSKDVSSDNPYNLNNANPLEYITNYIVPEARSEDDEIFVFYLDETTDPPTAHFRKKEYGMVSDLNDLKTYVFLKGYDSVVKDATFDIKGLFGGTSNFLTATGYTTNTLDPRKKIQSSSSETIDSTITTTTGAYTHTNPNQSILTVDSSGYTPEQSSNRLYYHIKSTAYSLYEATLTIIGDPTIEFLENIRIINVTDKGTLHHTSGIYFVNGIIDNISGGQMTTTLKLIRTGNIDEGFELQNYRTLLK